MAMLTRTALRFRPITRIAFRAYATEGESLVSASNDTPHVAKDITASTSATLPSLEQSSPSTESSDTLPQSSETSSKPRKTRRSKKKSTNQTITQTNEDGESTPTTSNQTPQPRKPRDQTKPRSPQSAADSPLPSQSLTSHIKRSTFTPLHLRNPPTHLLTLADLSPSQISHLLRRAASYKHIYKSVNPLSVRQSLTTKTIALMFSKRSTRTRVASETAANVLGGSAMFLGSGDVQLGVNESLEDTARVVGSMVDGFMARVGEHSEVETLAKYSPVPVINALSKLYHPTQILADLQTLWETYSPVTFPERDGSKPPQSHIEDYLDTIDPLACLQGKKAAWVGDTNNITNELLVTLPRFGMELAVASPKGYNEVEPEVWKRVVEAGTEGKITLTQSPEEALKDADVVITDTWISMGQETEKQARLTAFSGYQITNALVNSAGAKPDWKFLHCLPRKSEEVDDEVFYGERSVVFQEAENRKWTTMACFDEIFGKWRIGYQGRKSE